MPLAPRERFQLTVEHGQPDRPPIFLSATLEIMARLADHFEREFGTRDVVGVLEDDFRHVGPRPLDGPVPSVVPDCSLRAEGFYQDTHSRPLAYIETLDDVAAYVPDRQRDRFDFSPIGPACRAIHEQGFVTVFGNAGMFDLMNGLGARGRGYEQLLCEIMTDDEVAVALIDKHVEAELEFFCRGVEAGGGEIDILFIGEDCGTQNGPRFPEGLYGSIRTLNCDETLLAGVHGEDVDEIKRQHLNRSEWFSAIHAARLPHYMFTADVGTGEFRKVHEERAWINHLQFSPTDPNLLQFCHEGPWKLVDRIWHLGLTTGAVRQIHRRTVPGEIYEHEFFSPDGATVWFDLQIPQGETFYLAGVDVATEEETRYELSRDEWSIHYNVSPDGRLFCGDGSEPHHVAHAKDGKWIYLFRIADGKLQAERLVNMKNHDYRALEPNVHFTPDGKRVMFRSNMHGADQVYAVDIER